MMKGIKIEEIKKVNGGWVLGWPNGWDVAQEKKTIGWPNGWDVAEAGPLASCDPPYKTGSLASCDPPCFGRK